MKKTTRHIERPGLAWVLNGWRPIYSAREIRRGKNKGRLEVTYRNGSGFKQAKIKAADIKSCPKES